MIGTKSVMLPLRETTGGESVRERGAASGVGGFSSGFVGEAATPPASSTMKISWHTGQRIDLPIIASCNRKLFLHSGQAALIGTGPFRG